MKNRYKTAHEKSIINLEKVLLEEYPEDEIWINSKFRHEKRTIPNTNMIPDALNFTKQIAYEVHWKGNRKEEHFDNFPNGWRGINVFIVDIWETDDVYVLDLDNNYAHFLGQDWKKVPR